VGGGWRSATLEAGGKDVGLEVGGALRPDGIGKTTAFHPSMIVPTGQVGQA
jgi:hypothetical protein